MLFPTNKQPTHDRKLRGGYYTPETLAQYLVKWGLKGNVERILEPSCGDGNFLVAISQNLPDHNGKRPVSVVAVEIEEQEIVKAIGRLHGLAGNGSRIGTMEWIREDFFEAYEDLRHGRKFDLVVGNPPFIRFQHFEESSRKKAFYHLRSAGYKPTKLANAWVAFVQLGMELLNEGGRLAMVVPAELLQVGYAGELRNRLATHFEHVVLVGFERLVFPEIQQEILLLLAEGKRSDNHRFSNIHTIEFPDGGALLRSGDLNGSVAHIPSRHTRPGMKWTALLLDEPLFSALDEAESVHGLVKLGKLASVDIGVVTGRNKFFLLTNEQRIALDAASLVTPVVGRTSALKSVLFGEEDFREYSRFQPAFLLDLVDRDVSSFPSQLTDYISSGEHEGVHKGYKCRVRKRWFDVPSVYVPDAFLFRQIHDYPLLVLNNAGATSTDTIHRVRLMNGTDGEKLAAVFFNSLTLAWAEVCGRSYGGGVLELEPSEAEELPIPYHTSIDISVEWVNGLLKQGRAHEALDYVDRIVLEHYLGLDKDLIRRVRYAWEQLRDRRKRRGKGRQKDAAVYQLYGLTEDKIAVAERRLERE